MGHRSTLVTVVVALQIQTSEGRTFRMMANTEAEAKMWVDAMQVITFVLARHGRFCFVSQSSTAGAKGGDGGAAGGGAAMEGDEIEISSVSLSALETRLQSLDPTSITKVYGPICCAMMLSMCRLMCLFERAAEDHPKRVRWGQHAEPGIFCQPHGAVALGEQGGGFPPVVRDVVAVAAIRGCHGCEGDWRAVAASHRMFL